MLFLWGRNGLPYIELFIWDLNLELFIESTMVVDYGILVKVEPTNFYQEHSGGRLWITRGIRTYSISLQPSLDYEFCVGFKPTVFHYNFH